MPLSREDSLGIALITVVVVAVASVFVWVQIRRGERFELDGQTNCPVGEARYPSTVILIDQSDPLTESQRQYLLRQMDELKRDFDKYERVTVYLISEESARSPLPVFDRCNPGSPFGANPLTQNERRLRKAFERDFARPFDEVLLSEIPEGSTNTSPIIETLQAVMANHSLDERITSQRLVLVSDMFENVEGYSQYDDGFSFEAFSASAYSRRTSSNLVGVGVSIVYLWRDFLSPREVTDHLDFWEAYIRQNGGVVEHVYKVR